MQIQLTVLFMGAPLYVTFYLATFKILFWSLTFWILMMVCLHVGLLGFILFGTFVLSEFYVYFLHQIRDVFSQYFFLKVPGFLLSLSSPLVPLQILVWLTLSQMSFKLSSFFKILFLFHFSDWGFLYHIFPDQWFNILLHLASCWFLLECFPFLINAFYCFLFPFLCFQLFV